MSTTTTTHYSTDFGDWDKINGEWKFTGKQDTMTPEDTQKIAQILKLGIGKKPNTSTHVSYKDCHFWLTAKDGTIIDVTPPAHSGKRVYKAFSRSEQRKLNKSFRCDIKLAGANKIRQMFTDRPRDRCCGFNTYAEWCKNKELKITIGSMGFTMGNGDVFWEFG
jgi:hypothetical protein